MEKRDSGVERAHNEASSSAISFSQAIIKQVGKFYQAASGMIGV